jgi:hypothetical protein
MGLATAVLFALAASSAPVSSQLAGGNMRGDFGVTSATQPAPHFYFAPVYTRYSTNSIRDRDGDVRPSIDATIGVNAVAGFFWMVYDRKILGGNYGWMASVPWVGNSLEAPGIGVDVTNKLGFGDIYLQPFQLGWHRNRADFMVGTGLYMPTGRWELGASDNTGTGMWGFDVVAGSTVYLDGGRSFSLSALAAWETHTRKKDSEIQVGDMLTVEGGIGKSFLGGGASVGAAYFAQWKLTADDVGLDLIFPNGLDKATSYGIGPDVMFAIPVGGKLVATVTARYLWDFGVRSTTEGETFLAFLTLPLPSIPLER